MKFECKDLDRALAVPELLPDAREHAKDCPVCRRELWLWDEMSGIAGGLREQWDSPELWPKIQASLAREAKTRRPARRFDWQMIVAAAAALVVAAGLLTVLTSRFHQSTAPPSPDFLTEQALKEVEQSEAAYVKSIEKLSRVVPPKLNQAPAPLSAAYREKLQLLDSSIAELRSTVEQNRFNARLQNELAKLYREKQDTLKEIAQLGQKN